MMHIALLVFTLRGAADLRDDAPLDACEAGEIRAASCQAAERYLRAGLRDGQRLHVWRCEPVTTGVANAR